MDGRTFRREPRGLPPPASLVRIVVVTGMHEQSGLAEELDASAVIREPLTSTNS